MNTKERLEAAICRMEAAKKSWSETKADADLITLKNCEREVASIRQQLRDEEVDAPDQQPASTSQQGLNDSGDGADDDNSFKAPENADTLKDSLNQHVLNVYGGDALSNMTDRQLADIFLELLNEAHNQYEAKGDAEAMAKADASAETVRNQLEQVERESAERVAAMKALKGDEGASEETENKPAGDVPEEKPSTTPKDAEKPVRGRKSTKK